MPEAQQNRTFPCNQANPSSSLRQGENKRYPFLLQSLQK